MLNLIEHASKTFGSNVKKSEKYLVVISVIFFGFTINPLYADTTIVWDDPSGYFHFEGGVDGIGVRFDDNTFTVTDTDLADNLITDKITVQVSSSAGDSTALTLTETAVPGTFKNKNLIFTLVGNNEFRETDIAKIIIEDKCTSLTHGNCDTKIKESLTGSDGVFVASETTGIAGGIVIDLKETGPDTSIFTATLRFSTLASDAAKATLLVKPGDVITVFDLRTGEFINGLIIPSPPDKGAIMVDLLGTVTVKYNGVSESTNIKDDDPGGRGGGGLILPGLVLDFIRGGGGFAHEPPTIGKSLDGGRQVVNNGMCIDGQCWTVTQPYHNEMELIQMLTSPHTISNTIFCQQGSDKCNFVGVVFADKNVRDYNNPVMAVEASKNLQGDWNISVFDPDDHIADPRDALPENIVFSAQTIDEKLISSSFTIVFKNKDTGELAIGIQVRDDRDGVRTFWFNEGVEFIDADAYPYVETLFEPPIIVNKLCINESETHRYSCSFEKVKQLEIKRAEEMLMKIM